MISENFMGWESPGSALITGSSSGIGAEFARQLAQQGFDLILVARRKEKLDALSKTLQEKYSINAEVLVADLSKISDNEQVISKINEIENLDILINNAGFGILGNFLQIELMKYVDMINVHFTSPVMLCHATIPGMAKRKRGVIINTSSIFAIIKDSSLIMYTTTKSALAIFSELLNVKVKGTGIYIQALCPGFTYSEFHDTDTMNGFQRSWYNPEQWMKAEDVVSLSLDAVKSKSVIFIPGEINRQSGIINRKKKLSKYLNCDWL
ncbi:MAG: SDR family NAD(P)-dependent oxidoreductase [Candidatus Lokiarchaeota archaeon]|nr:SDR family NAD(P)-dependent oxidoreductase [Candidatus Lokiarchaeota archaeon]